MDWNQGGGLELPEKKAERLELKRQDRRVRAEKGQTVGQMPEARE